MVRYSLELELPAYIVGVSDVAHLLRELTQVDEASRQAALRAGVSGSRIPRMSHVSPQLEEVAHRFDCSLETKEGRQSLAKALEELRTVAPRIHVSFASEPPFTHLKRLVEWLRTSVHPQVLVQTSSDPSLVAGCVIRLPNRVLDLSLRQKFDTAFPVLVQEVKGL